MTERLENGDPNKLAFEQTVRVLDRQGEVLIQLRARAGVLLSGTGIIASLLGAQALRGRYSFVLAVVALGATTFAILLCVAVLWPVHDKDRLPDVDEPLPHWNRWPRQQAARRREWQLTISRDETRKIRGGSAITDELLDGLDKARRTNYLTIERRSMVFGWACAMLGVQLVLWAVVLLAEGHP